MPSKRSKLMNALTSEDPSNTVPKEETRAEVTPESSTNGAVPSPWWPCANTSPNSSKTAREVHLPTTEPGNEQQQESGEPQTGGSQTIPCYEGGLKLERILKAYEMKPTVMGQQGHGVGNCQPGRYQGQ